MKKILLSVIAGLIAIGSASALPSPEDRKALCEKHPDKYVWVAKTQACIPINPCMSDDKKIEKAYCDWDTLYVLTDIYDEWKDLVRIYVKKHNINCEPEDVIDDHFVLCKGNDVRVFAFHGIYSFHKDNLYESLRAAGRYGEGKLLVENICERSLGGVYDSDGSMCMKISKSDCENTKEIIKSGNFQSRIFVYWVDFGDKPGCNIEYVRHTDD